MSSKYPSGWQAVVTLVIGVGSIGVSGGLLLISTDPPWIPVLFMGGFGVVFTWISIRGFGLFSPGFSEGRTETTRQPSREEVNQAIREFLRSPFFIVGMILFISGPLTGYIEPLRGVEFAGRPPGFWISLSAFVLWFIPIHRKTQQFYRQ